MSATANDNWDSAERLWQALMHLMIAVHTELRPLLAEYGLTGPQWANLRVLAEAGPEGLRLSEISKRLRVTEGNITGVIDRLEENGLVVRVPHAQDRRVIMARLTPTGQEVCARVGPLFADRLRELFCGLSKSEMAALSGSLEGLARQVEGVGISRAGTQSRQAEASQ